MNHDPIKKDNLKNLPKFLIMLVLSAVAGAVFSILSFAVSEGSAATAITDSLSQLITVVVPWGILVCSLLLLLPSWILFRKAQQQFRGWDCEDEELPAHIEISLCRVLLLLSLLMIADFFFLSAGLVYRPNTLLAIIGQFLVSLGLSVFLQQKCVDLTRSLNPEKKGSVYDLHFQKKWLASCDEAEQRQIGQAAFHAFKVTCNTCLGLLVPLLLAHIIFQTGLLPIFIVLLIFGVLQISYIADSIRQTRR